MKKRKTFDEVGNKMLNLSKLQSIQYYILQFTTLSDNVLRLCETTIRE